VGGVVAVSAGAPAAGSAGAVVGAAAGSAAGGAGSLLQADKPAINSRK
jgi:hypothetical protein